ncbi:CD226 antigen Platelet and T-cell activation antigen 1 Precursor [Channa argus]|uniref:CD226 antigen Platelet and T-cell activation antigen 1 n=1 Tax=Channa argus TaxID=215402 RepID=A0A6G1Q6F8_CHAAH|nr:CD226 antigen Platelet and T-cell activation antigen 1 Precursor [Channa argus]
MASLTSVSSVAFFISLWIFVRTFDEFEDITAYPGDTVTLPCRAPNSTNITAVEWIRPDLKPEYVFVYQDQHFNTSNQHPSFKNRVELKDSEMKDGNVSLILKNVGSADLGMYKCYIAMDNLSWSSLVNLYVHAVPINITAEAGETITLPCKWPSIMPLFGVKVIRPDLDPNVVFFYSEFVLWFLLLDDDYPNTQHISYNNRVELKDSEMTDGEATLILKHVTINDSGTYECYVYDITLIPVPRNPALISIINLDVHSLANPDSSMLRIILHLVVFCPYFISTLLMVSLCPCRATERNPPAFMMTSPTREDD